MFIVGGAFGGREGMKARKLEGLAFFVFISVFLKVKISHNLDNFRLKSGGPVNHSVVLVLCICSHFHLADP